MDDPIKLATECALEAALKTGLAVAAKDWPEKASDIAAETAFESALGMHRRMVKLHERKDQQ